MIACLNNLISFFGLSIDFFRPLIIYKMIAVNAFPILLLIIGIMKVQDMRRYNYGCENEDPKYYPDESATYYLFCILMFTFALELLVFPSIVANKIVLLFRKSKLARGVYSTQSKGERLEQCLGYVFKCISMFNKSIGGQDLKNNGEMKDFATNLVRYMARIL